MLLSLTAFGRTIALAWQRNDPDNEDDAAPLVFESHLGGQFDPAPVEEWVEADHTHPFGFQP